RCRHQYHSNR
ncbi:cobalamin-independent synthase, Catalytic domain protein, partial [Vibrio parahaemolyticus V-223/04]